ncbi:hypothetical protein DFH07DRAFT_709160, partial [Mycena maculata]
FAPLVNTPISQFRDHWEVNTLGPLVLFQAAHTLLLTSPTKRPTFVFISSLVGSLGHFVPQLRISPYGSSKAAANFLIKALHDENRHLIAFAFSLGSVVTDMRTDSGTALGVDPPPPHNIEDSIAGLLSRIDGVTREATG